MDREQEYLVTTPIPATYQRAGANKLLGCLVYLIVAPFVALFLAIIIGLPIGLVLEAHGVPKERASLAIAAFLPLTGIGVAVWGYRDYLRRAALGVVIDRDRVTISVGSHRTVLRFEEVASIRLVPAGHDFACVLTPRSGRVLLLPPEIAPFSLVREPLEVTLIPNLVRRLDERIARGETVTLRISSARLVVMMTKAVVSLLVAVVLCLGRPWMLPWGLFVVRNAAVVVHQSWLGLRGGLVIESEGLRPVSDPSATPTPWDRLVLIRSDPVGLELRSTAGQDFALSALTDDFWPAFRWIKARARERRSA
ncbi:MAG: hypothetical protein P4L85_09415 [Paludisphaera borealis]|uniref:hypothetical protein n=1 Tax=Paludisphaera borealis TaxID=1387353 RepID=UPI00284ED5EE|nr:hypothetical protein [Paludisphaera borealis]MDR3619556.1 hypothetical protein [Paludisphaera borealis]